MEAIISNFRRARHHTYNNHMIITVKDTKDLDKLIGKEAIWKSPAGKEIKGKIVSMHGKKALRAIFEKGMPGQSIGTKIEIK